MKPEVKTKEFCPACGAAADGGQASSCDVCGKLLREGYFPLDNLKASYRNKTWQDENRPEPNVLYKENKNGASETAWAFTVYSMVPYLGILFSPGAVLIGGIGMFLSYRKPGLGGARTSKFSIGIGTLVLLFQLFLWWLLYYIPTLDRHF
jgi:hypothetical protein